MYIQESNMKVAKWGNSLAIRIPKDVAEALDLKVGSDVEIFPVTDGVGVARSMTREEAIRGLRKFRGLLPPDFKFDREEANAR
jgi:antitoxin MazE